MRKISMLALFCAVSLSGMQIAGPSRIPGVELVADLALHNIFQDLKFFASHESTPRDRHILDIRLTKQTLLLAQCARVPDPRCPRQDTFSMSDTLVENIGLEIKLMIVAHMIDLADDNEPDSLRLVPKIIGYDCSEWYTYLDQRRPAQFTGTFADRITLRHFSLNKHKEFADFLAACRRKFRLKCRLENDGIAWEIM